MNFLSQLRKDTGRQMKQSMKWDVRFMLVGIAVALVGFGLAMIGQTIGGTAGSYILLAGIAVVAIGAVIGAGFQVF